MEQGITQELGYLARFADNCRNSTLPKNYNGVLWSDDLARLSLLSLGLSAPQRRANPLVAAPAAFVLTFGQALPATAANAYHLRVISANGRGLGGAKVQTDGTLLGITDGQGNLQVGTVSNKVQVTRDGYHPLVLPASQLMDENLLILTPVSVTKAIPTAPAVTKAPTKAPSKAPTPVASKAPTKAPTPLATKSPTPTPTKHPQIELPKVTKTATPAPAPVHTPTPRPTQTPQAKATPSHRAAQTVQPRVSNAQTRNYTVKRGDSLWLIAWKVLGDPNRWNEIAELNPQLENPRVIYPGMRLALPTGVSAPSTYQVQHGDSLWSIAERTLGNGSRWREIYNINRPMIRNPHWILPGQELLIPRR